MGEVVQFPRAHLMSRARNEPDVIRLTEIEELFFDVLWKQIRDHGADAPFELHLPLGTRVVHRSIVSKAYRISSLPSDASQQLSENTIKSRWLRSTRRLRENGVIGFQEPYFWHTGAPVLGKPATHQHRPGGVA
jgi:hypothetical protein